MPLGLRCYIVTLNLQTVFSSMACLTTLSLQTIVLLLKSMDFQRSSCVFFLLWYIHTQHSEGADTTFTPHLKLPEVRMGQGFGGFRCRSRERRLRRLDSSSICFVWFNSLITPWLTLFCSPSSFFLPTVAPIKPFYLIRNKNLLQ